MKAMLTGFIVSLVIFGGVEAALAEDLKDKVKTEILSAGLHPGMPPGLYVCAGSHLHVKGSVQNLSGVTLASIKLEGRSYDTEGKLLGKAHLRRINPPRLVPLAPGQKAEFDLEFLTITGPQIPLAVKQEIVVLEARPNQ